MIFAGDEKCKHRWVPVQGHPLASAGMYWFRCKECGRVETATTDRGPNADKEEESK